MDPAGAVPAGSVLRWPARWGCRSVPTTIHCRSRSWRSWLHGIRTDYVAQPYLSPAEAAAAEWNEDKQAVVADRVASRVVDSPGIVTRRLRALAAATGADELVITAQAHALADRVLSYRLLAEAWQG